MQKIRLWRYVTPGGEVRRESLPDLGGGLSESLGVGQWLDDAEYAGAGWFESALESP